jgi:2'-5' RNA ligase
MENSLILTVLLDKSSQERFDFLRDLHFPKKINYLKAHLTLFHKLPADVMIYNEIELIATQQLSFKMGVIGLVSIGNGVAFKIESPLLQHLHAGLLKTFEPLLIPQDKQKLWPHITVQNKVPAATANALKEELEENFEPYSIQVEGLVLWEYCNGPWKLHRIYNFTNQGAI